ncbi:TPA: trp operon leader peptide [Enterobacter hormaechei]
MTTYFALHGWWRTS